MVLWYLPQCPLGGVGGGGVTTTHNQHPTPTPSVCFSEKHYLCAEKGSLSNSKLVNKMAAKTKRETRELSVETMNNEKVEERRNEKLIDIPMKSMYLWDAIRQPLGYESKSCRFCHCHCRYRLTPPEYRETKGEH